MYPILSVFWRSFSIWYQFLYRNFTKMFLLYSKATIVHENEEFFNRNLDLVYIVADSFEKIVNVENKNIYID